MDQKKVRKLVDEKARLKNAAEEIINLLVESGFSSRNLSARNKSIDFYPPATSLLSLDIMDGKLTIKVESRIVSTSTQERLGKLARDKGWVIERI